MFSVLCKTVFTLLLSISRRTLINKRCENQITIQIQLFPIIPATKQNPAIHSFWVWKQLNVIQSYVKEIWRGKGERGWDSETEKYDNSLILRRDGLQQALEFIVKNQHSQLHLQCPFLGASGISCFLFTFCLSLINWQCALSYNVCLFQDWWQQL